MKRCTSYGTGDSRRIGSEPVAVGAIDDLHLEVVIGALRIAVRHGVVGSGDVYREARVGNTSHADLPSAYDLVEDKGHAGTELAPAANRKVINHIPIDCVAHVLSDGAVLRVEVIDVFGIRTVRRDAGNTVEACAVGHTMAP